MEGGILSLQVNIHWFYERVKTRFYAGIMMSKTRSCVLMYVHAMMFESRGCD
jgi:hypothetical protein